MEGTNGERWRELGDEGGGPIAVLFAPGRFTVEQYDGTVHELERRGLGDPEGRLLHVSFEVEGKLHTLDVWESEEAFLGEFSQTLVDCWARQGREPGRPAVGPVHRLMLGAAGTPRVRYDGQS
jgi:hypothetical protein